MALLLAHWIGTFFSSTLGQLGSGIIGAGVLLGAGKKWIKGFWSFCKKAHGLVGLLNYELQTNGGNSMKDDTKAARKDSAEALKVSLDTDSKIDSLTSRFDSYISSHAIEHQTLAAAASANVVQFPGNQKAA